jgi:hypothetical protein
MKSSIDAVVIRPLLLNAKLFAPNDGMRKIVRLHDLSFLVNKKVNTTKSTKSVPRAMGRTRFKRK